MLLEPDVSILEPPLIEPVGLDIEEEESEGVIELLVPVIESLLSAVLEELDGILEELDGILEELDGAVEVAPILVPEELLGIAEEDSAGVSFLAEGVVEQAPSIKTEAMTTGIANDLSFILNCSFYMDSLCQLFFSDDWIQQPRRFSSNQENVPSVLRDISFKR